MRKKYWKLWDMAQEDPQYRMLLLRMGPLEREYDKVLQTLPREQMDTVCDFVSLCEEMNERILEIACEKTKFVE